MDTEFHIIFLCSELYSFDILSHFKTSTSFLAHGIDEGDPVYSDGLPTSVLVHRGKIGMFEGEICKLLAMASASDLKLETVPTLHVV